MCDCIAKTEKKLREDTGDPDAYILCGFSFPEDGSIKNFIPIRIEYRKKKKDGSLGKRTEGNVVGAYCPICGKKIRWMSKEKEAVDEKGN
jgi:hypothetical protein